MAWSHIFLALVISLTSFIRCGEDPHIDFPTQPEPSFITRTNHSFDGNIAAIRGLNTGAATQPITYPITTQTTITDVPDPSYITRTNYTFDGGILPLRNYGNFFLSEGTTQTYPFNIEGVVLNDYDSTIHGVWHDRGFFIQDTNAAIFVRSLSGISVNRGDRVIISVSTIFRSSCSSCSPIERGRLQIKEYTISSVVSTNNLIYCQDITPPVSVDNPPDGPRLVKVQGTVSKKNTATWAMDNNTWGVRIPYDTDQNQSGIAETDSVIIFGVVEAYSSSPIAGGQVTNYYPLWLFSPADSLHNITALNAANTNNNNNTNTQNPTSPSTPVQYVEGIVTNSYDASKDGTYHNGFFIQDKNAMLFIRITDSSSGVSVTRGQRVKIVAREIITSGSLPPGQLQLKNPLPSEITLISTGNKVFCRNITPPTSAQNPLWGPQFVKIKGIVSHKSTDSPATWGLNNNSWGIRIPIERDRNFPNLFVGDEVTLYGVVDWYVMPLAGGIVPNHYALWLHHTHQTVFDYSEPK